LAEKNSLFSKGSIGTFEYNLGAGNPPREPPPKHLPADEKAEWRRVVTGLPRDWIPAGAYALLEIYVSAVCSMRAHRALMLAAPAGSPLHHKVSKLYRHEADMVTKLAKMLRLGPRHDRTKLRTVSNLPKPWDLGATDVPAAPARHDGFDWPKDDGAA
jgi:phage terminase small subunit